MDTMTDQARRPEVLAPGAGHHLHFLNHLATVKVHPGDHGAMSVVEFVAPRGLGPPLHRHHDEDEVFVVLEGELAFMSGDRRLQAGPGGIAHLPRGLAHTFQVLSGTARFTCITATRGTTPAFAAMVAALGEETRVPELPEPGYIDATHVADVCLHHGIEVVGPPPTPLD